MEVALSSAHVAWLDRKIASGEYQSVQEILEASLDLLRARDAASAQRAELRDALAIAVAQADRGQTRPFTPELAIEIKLEGRHRLSLP